MQNYRQKLKPLILIAIIMLIFSALDGKITHEEWYSFGVICLLVIPFLDDVGHQHSQRRQIQAAALCAGHIHRHIRRKLYAA